MFARAISRRFDYVVASTACRTSKELIDVVAVFDNKLIARLKSLTKKTPNMQVQYKARRVQQ
jgi:phosphoribosylanthranilate isomerase